MLYAEVSSKAAALGVPLAVHLDLTYRCNEDCVHCYLEHTGGEFTTLEVRGVLEQLASAGCLFVAVSGGEPFLRRDLFTVLESASALKFGIRLKTNATLIGPAEASRIRQFRPERVDVSLYSLRAAVHDAITRAPGSLERTLRGIRHLREEGVRVALTHVITALNASEYQEVMAFATDIGAKFQFDAMITPKVSGDRSTVRLNVPREALHSLLRDHRLLPMWEEFCKPPEAPDGDFLDGAGCGALQSACYISPVGDVYPCVQWPVLLGNIRRTSFEEIWRGPQAESLRAVRNRDLPQCSRCSHFSVCQRCPGLACMEGDPLGPSSQNCEFAAARTGTHPAILHRSA